ncbi:hypothetical protein JXB41_07795 [Candidatus Woesearchaeota archaeon]|nr:hypothetical protein [Candidatus Woesearchaeota archaeon]
MPKVCIFGASLGYGIGDNRGWSGRLKDYYKDKIVYNMCIPANTTTMLLERIENECKARSDHTKSIQKIIISIGTTDSALLDGKEPLVTKKTFKENLLKIFKISGRYAEEVIFIGLTPVDETKTRPYKHNKHFTNKRILEYNKIIEQCCLECNVIFIDFFQEMINLNFTSWLADGVHPNKKGYDLFFDFIKKYECINSDTIKQ